MGVEKAKEQQIQSPSILTEASTAWSQQGPHVNRGTLVNQTTLVGGQTVPAGSFSQNLKFADRVTYNNYQDMFLLSLTTVGSGSCNISSASLPKHKLGREA